MQNLLRQIPSVDLILSSDFVLEYIDLYSREYVKDKIRGLLSSLKEEILEGRISEINMSMIEKRLEKLISVNELSLRTVVNGTGVLLHTNMGRALFSETMAESVKEIITGYNTLEFDLSTGKRGHRDSHIEELIKTITGAEGAVVVNNNAAAVMLMLDTFSKGKEAIVSRGELVEIGGSFRVPSVMEASGALLKEVGTTNKTHLSDYEDAINENTGVILKVHTSNYKIVGFTESVDGFQLVKLASEHSIPVIEDLGAGSLVPLDRFGLEREPTVQDQVKKGIDLVSFSGDKLLGGPQCGIIVGKKKYIDKIKKNQLLRALRVGKMTLAVLQEVLNNYRYEKLRDIPFYNMLLRDDEWFLKTFEGINQGIENDNLQLELIDSFCQVGGGSLPMEKIPSKAIAMRSNLYEGDILDQLRKYEIPVIARLENNTCILEMRTLRDKDIDIVIRAVNNVN